MTRNGDSTHPCRSSTPTVNGHDLTLPTQTSEQEYRDLTASNRRPSTRTHGKLLKTFHKEPSRMLSRGRQIMCRRFQHTPKISQKFAGEWKCGVYCYARDENRTAYHSTLIQIFRGIFFQTLGNEMLIIWKFPKSIAGRTKDPRGPHEARGPHAARGPRVWDPWYMV